jgi:immune inhibitor A
MHQNNKKLLIILIIAGIFVFLCCLAVLIIVVLGFVNFSTLTIIEDGPVEVSPEPVGIEMEEFDPKPLNEAIEENQDDDNAPDIIVVDESFQQAYESLSILENSLIPLADPRELAQRLKGIQNIPETLETAPVEYEVGDLKTFWLTNLDTNQNFEQETQLAYKTDHAYFWIDSRVSYNEEHLSALAEAFENQMYPTNRAFFGSEWSPGIDNDERLYIVYARGLGSSVAGYFSSIDSVHPLANPYSNAHETFMLNADTIGFNEDFTYGVLAHEFQHMIHWYQDMNETTWLNEGFSELANLLNGYYTGGFDRLYLMNTDIQLNDWPNDQRATTPHYGASFLFVTYFLDRFGDEATQALVAHPQNGMVSIDLVLEEIDARDGLTGELIGADDLFRDWAVSNLLNDPVMMDGRYAYTSLPTLSPAAMTDYIMDCDQVTIDEAVSQYGVDAYQLQCPGGNVTVTFEGQSLVNLLPVTAYSGDYAFWSNKGDHSDMRLTREFDLSGLGETEDATLSYRLWYDIETDYDYVYLLVSENGEDWEFIETPNGTDADPVGNNLGWGYHDVTGGWIEESIDLSAYAGQSIWLRFEYVTDAAVNGEGLLLDDVSFPAVDYFSDFEEDDGGWQAEGFVRLGNFLPQTYLVTTIEVMKDGTIQVSAWDLSEENQASRSYDFDNEIDSVVFVVSGSTRFTRTKAQYLLQID